MKLVYKIEVVVKDDGLTRDLGDDLHPMITDGLWAATTAWSSGLPWILEVEVTPNG